jgi:predicted lipoprotein with Yx(FWY)xxD motif
VNSSARSSAKLAAASAAAVAAAISITGTIAVRSASAQDAAAAAPQRASIAAVATVGERSTPLGKLLVNGRGFTLYVFSRDSRGTNRCISTSGCSSVWPGLTTSSHPRAGSGVKASMLGTITLANGSRQVTYEGRPLYTYAFDSAPAETDYVGATAFGGVWQALSPSGKLVG